MGFKGDGFSAPTSEAFAYFVKQVRQSRQQGTAVLEPQFVRATVFEPINDLIAAGGSNNLEQAAELLAELDAAAFRVLDWQNQALYLKVLVNAWTKEP